MLTFSQIDFFQKDSEVKFSSGLFNLLINKCITPEHLTFKPLNQRSSYQSLILNGVLYISDFSYTAVRGQMISQQFQHYEQ